MSKRRSYTAVTIRIFPDTESTPFNDTTYMLTDCLVFLPPVDSNSAYVYVLFWNSARCIHGPLIQFQITYPTTRKMFIVSLKRNPMNIRET